MSDRESFPEGVPCWVEVCGPNTAPLRAFYGEVLGWEFDGPGPMPGGGEYWVARTRGRDVCGLSTVPEAVTPCWNSFVAVQDAAVTADRAQALGATALVRATPVPPAGAFAMLADPTGACLGVWQSGARSGAQVVNEPGAWAMSVLHTPDPEQATAYYRDLFGWEVEMFGELGMFRLPGYVGGEPSQPVPRDVVAAFTPLREGLPRWSVGLWVDNADRAAEAARSGGGRVLSEPKDEGPFREAVLADPNGATFEVSQLLH